MKRKMRKSPKRKGLLPILLIFMLFLTGCNNEETRITGNIEAEVDSYYAEVSGKIIDLPVTLGQDVKKGDILAIIDSTDAQFNLNQAEQTLVKAKNALAQLSDAVEPEQVQQSRNQVTVQEQNYKNAEANYQRILEQYNQQKSLYDAGAVAKTIIDDLEHQLTLAGNALVTASAQLDSAKQQLALIQKDSVTSYQIEIAKADVAQAENQVAQLTDLLDKYTIKANCDGKVLSISYTQGALITAGSPFIDLSQSGENYWVGYIPDEYIRQIDYGQELAIESNEVRETATVSYIDIKNQYAPKDYQNDSNRNQTTVKVKCKLSESTSFQVGIDADLILPPSGKDN